MNQELSDSERREVQRAFDRVSMQGWGLALGFLSAAGLFLATVILVIKGGPNPGPHLELLGVYLPGYSVTWLGSVVGAGYAFALGYIGGRAIATLYNWMLPRS